MRASSDLGKLHSALQRRIQKIGFVYRSGIAGDLRERSRIISFCAIEFDNLFLSGLRQFTVSSLTGSKTVRGHRVTTAQAFLDSGQVAAYVMSILNAPKYIGKGRPTSLSRGEEQKVRNPKDTEKVFLNCSASNYPSLANALALNFNFFNDMATVRNFYAHRNDDTYKKVANLGQRFLCPNIHHPDDIISTAGVSGPLTLFEDWLNEAELFFDELMK